MYQMGNTKRILVSAGIGLIAICAQPAWAGPRLDVHIDADVHPATVQIYRLPEERATYEADIKRLQTLDEAWRYYNNHLRVNDFQITRFIQNYATRIPEFKQFDTKENQDFAKDMDRIDREIRETLADANLDREAKLKRFQELAQQGQQKYEEFFRRNLGKVERPEDQPGSWAPKGYLGGDVVPLGRPAVEGGSAGSQGVHIGTPGVAHELAASPRSQQRIAALRQFINDGTGNLHDPVEKRLGFFNTLPLDFPATAKDSLYKWVTGKLDKGEVIGAEKTLDEVKSLLRFAETIKDPQERANFFYALGAVFKGKGGPIAADALREMAGDPNSQDAKESFKGMAVMIGAVERMRQQYAAISGKAEPAAGTAAHEKWEADREEWVGNKLSYWVGMGREFRDLVDGNSDHSKKAWRDFLAGNYDSTEFTKEMRDALHDDAKRTDRDLLKSLCNGHCVGGVAQLDCRTR